ncbi:TraV family lipoprotein [Novosphingobium profundi]|uniref:TraV family lipoprotein n=1 Tax=Novosphingobium profundi TaxID=1774954 RepID=UPI001BDB281F|nr:TraV family lipoprotein [Novosphingobium profundi]MBT0667388.1 TraV family lipoprotein [Novosphingobium profundi]
MPIPTHLALNRSVLALSLLASLAGCAAVGSVLSPYSEKFDCKNSDHGQCIHPERAYADAVAGVASKPDPEVTNDRAMLGRSSASTGPSSTRAKAAASAYGSYRESVYRELKGLIEAPVTPMLKPARTVRTLILPYAGRQRPDRLYMPRYVYSVIDRPVWVVGGALVASPDRASRAPILGQVREPLSPDGSVLPAAQPGSSLALTPSPASEPQP